MGFLFFVVVLFCLFQGSVGYDFPQTFGSSWHVKLQLAGNHTMSNYLSLWSKEGGFFHQTSYLFHGYRFTDDLIIPSGDGFNSCYSFSPENGTCASLTTPLGTCVYNSTTKKQCGSFCGSCQSFKPLWSEFAQPNTIVTNGCANQPDNLLFNVTIFHATTNVLCWDKANNKPVYYTRTLSGGSFESSLTAILVDWSTEVVDADFTIPTYCPLCGSKKTRTNHNLMMEQSGLSFLFLQNRL